MVKMFSATLHFCLLTSVSAIDWKATVELTLALYTEAPSALMCKPVKKSFVQVK